MSIEDDMQRILNEARRDDLCSQYGARFSPRDPALPPDIERLWLDHIERFELLCQGALTTTVRRYIGSPPVRLPAEVSPEEVGSELERLFDLLRTNNISVHFARSVPEAEAYRFIVEEVLDREIEDIRMDGLSLNFLYEEFHPDDEQDALMAAEDFLFALFTRNESILSSLLHTHGEIPPGGSDSPPSLLASRVKSFLGGMAAILDWDSEAIRCTVDGGRATVEAQVSWTGLETGTLSRVHAEGKGRVHLQKSGGFWFVTAADIPGIVLACC